MLTDLIKIEVDFQPFPQQHFNDWVSPMLEESGLVEINQVLHGAKTGHKGDTKSAVVGLSITREGLNSRAAYEQGVE